MKISSFKVYILIIVALACLNVSCASETEIEQGSCAAISSSGYLMSQKCQLLRWQASDLPVRITIEEGTPTDIIEAIRSAADYWERETGLDYLFDIQNATVDRQNDINYNINLVALRSETEWPNAPIQGQQDEPAKTVYYFNNYGLYNANIFFNAAFHANGNYDIDTIALHEMGHVLGLDHDNDTSIEASIMHAKVSPGEQRGLTIRDLDRIRNLYLYQSN